jgi:hyperosmotically inducible periplasmic protein
MNRRRGLKTERIPPIVLGVLLALAIASCERSGVTDSAITATVKSKLAAGDENDAINVNVDTRGGEVALSGVVKTQADKEQAERVAANTEGVTRVINNITVDTGGEHEAGRGAMTASDLTILSRIKTRYVAEGVIGADVGVKDGVVTLKGAVEDTQTRARAESIARATTGVREVNNLLKVRQ